MKCHELIDYLDKFQYQPQPLLIGKGLVDALVSNGIATSVEPSAELLAKYGETHWGLPLKCICIEGQSYAYIEEPTIYIQEEK